MLIQIEGHIIDVINIIKISRIQGSTNFKYAFFIDLMFGDKIAVEHKDKQKLESIKKEIVDCWNYDGGEVKKITT